MSPQVARDIVALVDEFSPVARQGVGQADAPRRPLPAFIAAPGSPAGERCGVGTFPQGAGTEPANKGRNP